jgi:hypothetical protein
MLRSLARQLQRAARAIDDERDAVDASKRNDTISRQPRSEELAIAIDHVAQLAQRARAGAPAARLRSRFFFSRCSRCKRDDGARAGGGCRAESGQV